MRQFFYQKELKLKKKRLLMMVACMAVLLAGYVILTWPKKVESEAPTVIVESAEKGDVEIYGEYVGRIRAQQFVGGTCACGRVFGEYAFRRRNICHQEPGTFCDKPGPV